MRVEDLRVSVYADGADIGEMKKEYERGIVKGFTTNPTLMKKAGVADYRSFARQAVEAFPDLPISFEVFSDEFDTMAKEARVLSAMGPNVFVKIPVTNTRRESSAGLIRRLSSEGMKLNITAVFTLSQTEAVLDALCPGTENIISLFAGRITNAGVDAEPIMKEASRMAHEKPGTKTLWASSRELFNIIQADRTGTDIITVTFDLLSQITTLGKDLEEYSLDTVKMFYEDGKALGFHILEEEKP